jgi:glucose/arabinose dehydrogenase
MTVPPYHGIPADNPFVGSGGGERPEIYAYGLRNPWRISYDAVDDQLWVGDVGQGPGTSYEEIDIITNGANYGWNCREGLHAYSSPSPACATATGLVDPFFEYSRASGQAITGGYVYRGPTLTSLTGRYVYADYNAGTVWALMDTMPVETEVLKDTSYLLSTFGVAEDGELFVADWSPSGAPSQIYRITQTEVTP